MNKITGESASSEEYDIEIKKMEKRRAIETLFC